MFSRLNAGSLRVRLTLWYSGALILVALVLAGASRRALAVSLDHALDQSLRHRLIGLHVFIDKNSHDGFEQLAARLQGLDHLGELFQVFGPKGELMAQSDGLARHGVRPEPPGDIGPGMLFRSTGPFRFPVRMATQRIFVDGQPIVVEVADPQRKYEGVLREFNTALYVALPFVLALAGLGGFWMSGKAISPVDRIIDEARAISPNNLEARLSVPKSGDELQRLSETLNQMLERVEQALLQMRQFTADASHELRAPMTLIYTAAQFALRRERSPEELRESLQKILREAKRCTELINELLWLARADAGTSSVELVPTDLKPLLDDVAAEVGLLASAKRISVAAEVPELHLVADADAASLRRMLLILLDNAVKYTPEGGTVRIIGTEADGQIAISVADNGPGIAAEQLAFVFDRFWRADRVRSRDAGGTGLGLAIAREIAAIHHAELTAESSLGHGSTFTVRIRCSSSRAESVSESFNIRG